MRRPTERRWVPWLNGVRRTTSHSTSTRPRSCGGFRQSREHTPITIDKTPVERMSSFKFLCVHITRISHGLLTQMQCWRRHISASSSWEGWGSLERAPASSDPSTPALWRASWPAASPPGLEAAPLATAALQRVVRTARHIVGGELPSLQDIYTRRCMRIIKDSSHPSHRLLSLLPSGRRLRSIQSALADWGIAFPSGYQANEQSELIHPTSPPTHTTCHALHINTVLLDHTHTLH